MFGSVERQSTCALIGARPDTHSNARVLKQNHPALEVIESKWQIVWLGVRDDFRNWLVTAA